MLITTILFNAFDVFVNIMWGVVALLLIPIVEIFVLYVVVYIFLEKLSRRNWFGQFIFFVYSCIGLLLFYPFVHVLMGFVAFDVYIHDLKKLYY